MSEKYSDDQYVDEEELAEIEALFKERKDNNDWCSGEELAKKATELYMQFRSVEASLAIEGLVVTRGMRKLIFANLTGSISHEEFIKKALEYKEEE